jgi:hypothetical protein
MAGTPAKIGKVDQGVVHIAGIGLIGYADGPKQRLGGGKEQTLMKQCIVVIISPLYLIFCRSHQDKIKSADISEKGVARLSQWGKNKCSMM